MPVENLQEAALVLQGAYPAIERLLAEAEALQVAAHDEYLDGPRTGESLEAWLEESGFGVFDDAVCAFVALLGTVEAIGIERPRLRNRAS